MVVLANLYTRIKKGRGKMLFLHFWAPDNFCCKEMDIAYSNDAIDNEDGEVFIKQRDIDNSVIKYPIKLCPFCGERIELE